MVYRLETERLRLREWLPEDREPLAAMNADRRVMEFSRTRCRGRSRTLFRSDRRRMGGVRSGTVCRRTTRGRTADRVDGAAPCGLRGVVYTLYRDRMAVRRRGLGAGLCHRSGAGRAARCLRPVGTAAGVLLYGGGEPSFGAGDAAAGDAQPRRIRSSGLARRASPAAACALCGCTGYFRGTIFR